MQHKLEIYNTLTRKKEIFEPLNPPYVGMYVCGPTVYSDPHLGHARGTISFDLVFRYLSFLGYQVRYVRNITDVGHLEHDSDDGEDKIAKTARLAKLEPMQIVQKYMNSYHKYIGMLNCLPPSIEPRASGHIIEQQELVEKIMDNGYAYMADGNVYFDVEKYALNHHYGKLSGRVLDDLLSTTRKLDGQDSKKSPFDFALWKAASPEHIMQWKSKWGSGFPGWHLECTAMSTKYLGEQFDIHGGGLDLLFPHHECEIAQSVGAYGAEAVKYWLHNNMITIDGQKMARSLNNFITLEQLFTGNHPKLSKAFHPMVIRFFILQAHYRNQLDFTDGGLIAAEKGFDRLMTAIKTLDKIEPAAAEVISEIGELRTKCYEAMNDDLNTPILLANLFDGVRIINAIAAKQMSINTADLTALKSIFNDFTFKVLGLDYYNKANDSKTDLLLNEVVDFILTLRQEAKQRKDFAGSDSIRNKLNELGIVIKDTKEGYEWELKKTT